MLNLASSRRYEEPQGRNVFFRELRNVRNGAHPTGGNPVGAALAYCRRWGPLVLLVLAANVFLATLAWSLVGLFLK